MRTFIIFEAESVYCVFSEVYDIKMEPAALCYRAWAIINNDKDVYEKNYNYDRNILIHINIKYFLNSVRKYFSTGLLSESVGLAVPRARKCETADLTKLFGVTRKTFPDFFSNLPNADIDTLFEQVDAYQFMYM